VTSRLRADTPRAVAMRGTQARGIVCRIVASNQCAVPIFHEERARQYGPPSKDAHARLSDSSGRARNHKGSSLPPTGTHASCGAPYGRYLKGKGPASTPISLTRRKATL